MRLRLPTLLMAATALVVGAVVWGGVSLARQESSHRVERDRWAITGFSRAFQEELEGLEERLEKHLRVLCSQDLNDRFALRREMNRLVGVRQISALRDTGVTEFHLIADSETEDDATLPYPVFDSEERPLGRSNLMEFQGRESLGKGRTGSSGWVSFPAAPLFYFFHASDRRTVMVLLDQGAVRESIDAWLEDWQAEKMPLVWEEGGADAMAGPNGVIASIGEVPNRDPDVILQMVSRFGEWQVQSWDPRRVVVSYDNNMLAGAGILAGMILILGGFSAWHLRRILRDAEQRVSFVNRVSHELRTPLTNILLNADLADDGANPAARKRLALVREEGGRLARLIDNVLTFSRKDQEELKLEIRACQVRELVEDVLAQFATSLDRRGIAVSVEGAEGNVRVDRDAFFQVLGNLISNVEKYALAGGELKIELRPDGSQFAIRVSDRGPGIRESDAEQIFLPFYRVDDRVTEGSSGTGLGLAIARELTERMGGSLRLLESQAGAVFELRLPTAEVESGHKVIHFPESQAS